MPREDPGPSIKDPELYEKLRDEGSSTGKAARIANAAARDSRSEVGRRGGDSPPYDEWTPHMTKAPTVTVGAFVVEHSSARALARSVRRHEDFLAASSAFTAAPTSVVSSSVLREPPEDSRCARTNQWNSSSSCR